MIKNIKKYIKIREYAYRKKMGGQDPGQSSDRIVHRIGYEDFSGILLTCWYKEA